MCSPDLHIEWGCFELSAYSNTRMLGITVALLTSLQLLHDYSLTHEYCTRDCRLQISVYLFHNSILFLDVWEKRSLSLWNYISVHLSLPMLCPLNLIFLRHQQFLLVATGGDNGAGLFIFKTGWIWEFFSS